VEEPEEEDEEEGKKDMTNLSGKKRSAPG